MTFPTSISKITTLYGFHKFTILANAKPKSATNIPNTTKLIYFINMLSFIKQGIALA